MPQHQSQWLSPAEVLQRIHQVGDPDWDERGASVLQSVVEAWKKRAAAPSVNKSPYGKSFFTKATPPGPKYTGSTQDASGRHNCFRSGQHVPCEQFGGKGEGWNELRSQEDLYDALRRLIDELKAGVHDGWHEIIGLLVHTPPEDLEQLKNDHSLYAPEDVKQEILKKIQSELQHVGHGGGKSYWIKAEEEPETPKQPETPKLSDEKLSGEKPQPPTQQQAAPPPLVEPPPPQEPPPVELPPPEENEEMIVPEIQEEEALQAEERQEEEDAPRGRELTKMDFAFLNSIKEAPEDDAPRMIYADWLMENGEYDRGEHMQLQIAYANTDWDSLNYNLALERLNEIEERMYQLEDQHPEWFWPWGDLVKGSQRYAEGLRLGMGKFRRGMLDVEGSAALFRRILNYHVPSHVGSDEVARLMANVESVRLFGGVRDVANIVSIGQYVHSMNWLPYISKLQLSGLGYPSLAGHAGVITNSIRAFASQNLRELYLGNTRIGSDLAGAAMQSLFSRGGIPNLEVLDLSDNDLSDASVQNLISYGVALNETGRNKIKILNLSGLNENVEIHPRNMGLLRDTFGDALSI